VSADRFRRGVPPLLVKGKRLAEVEDGKYLSDPSSHHIGKLYIDKTWLDRAEVEALHGYLEVILATGGPTT
jgi:hypothetical protein